MLSSGVLSLVTFVTFHLPPPGPPVVAAEAYVASDLSRPRHAVEVDAGVTQVVIPFDSGTEAVVVLRRHDGAYYVHGPFRWPSEDQVVPVDGRARHTVQGRVPPGRVDSRPAWIDPEKAGVDEWPRCAIGPDGFQCVGVPLEAAGVVAVRLEPPALFATVRPSVPGGVLTVPVRSARWAAVVTLEGADHEVGRARLLVLAPRASPLRGRPARVMLTPADGVSVERLTARTYVISGVEHRDDLLLQADGEDLAMARVPLATSTVGLLHRTAVSLQPAMVTTGRVVDRSGRAAEGAQLAIAEIVEQSGADGRPRTIKRQVGELESGADGAFTLRGLGAGRYELLALHPRSGRGSITFEPGGRPLLLCLDPGRRVAGRVLRDGVPLPAVWVDIPASHEGYVAAVDPMDVLAPATTTGADGRFRIALPPRGATELRFDYQGEVTRLALPSVADGEEVDLGDIVLRRSIGVRVTYVGDERCALVAAGPLGHTGMALAEAQIVAPGTRLLTLPESGRWLLELRCPRGAARPEPAVLDVPPQAAEWSVHVTMAPP